MWELDYKESWAPKNWCFWTVVLEKTLLRVPWTARRSNQSILKEISPGCSLEGLMLKLKLPILWPPDAKNWLIWKDPDAGKDEGGRRRGWQRMKWLDGIMDSIDMSLSKRNWWWTGKPGVMQSMGLQRVGHYWATELNDNFDIDNYPLIWLMLKSWMTYLPWKLVLYRM